jgi:dipeptidyl aminopeptidase/acylaminoacyl peptidase
MLSLILTGLLSGLAAGATSPEPASGYDKPPQNILDVLNAPTLPNAYVSPTHDSMVLVSWQYYPSMAHVAAPFLRLAGARVEPKNHSRHDTPGGYGITPCARSYTVVGVDRGSELRVALPAGGCVGYPAWSADGRRIAFRNITDQTVELWLIDVTTGKAQRVPKVRLNAMLDDGAQWMPDQKTLLVKLVPDGGPPPPLPVVPSGPSIQESNGEKGQSSTYEARDTLTSKYDEKLFDYYAASQLALVDAASGRITRLGKVGAYEEVRPAPDGEHILVGSVHRPYSYVVTYERFPEDFDVWDLRGAVVHRIASLPLADRVPIHGVPTGPRDFAWRSTEPATLIWAEALDNGDWNVNVPARDRIMMQKAPFTTPAIEVARTEQRFNRMLWGERPSLALLSEYDRNRRWTRTFIVDVDEPGAKPKLLWDLSMDEHYQDPGRPVQRQRPNGSWVVQQDGDNIYVAGTGSSPDGDRPFLDRLNLETRKSERLFRSDKTSLEWFLAFSGPDNRTFLTWHQSPSDPPNGFRRVLGSSIADPPAGEAAVASVASQITRVTDPTPVIRAIKKKLVKYKRKDGVDLSFTLFLPPGYQEGTRVPTILYAYPLDYAEAATAGQVTGSEETFTQLYQYQLLLLAGYAIIDRAAFPIVGDPKTAYDTYLEQLVLDAQAAVDKAVQLGVADPDRIGITGHSHGALMTANLVAHSNLFRAGVATSGAYNKTLTPYGFQNERRSVWEAQSVYLKVSPFFYADKLKTPLLIIHGEDDANPGTTPLQAEKLYEAIRGNGGTTRLVMLPHEPHWYAALESNQQLIYEMVRWFDKYVKNAPARTVAAEKKTPTTLNP